LQSHGRYPAEIRATVKLDLAEKSASGYSRGDGKGVILRGTTQKTRGQARAIMETLALAKEK